MSGSPGCQIYSMLPPNSPLFDQNFLGPAPQAQTINVPGSKPGDLLSFSPNQGVGNGAVQILPMILQPPGNTQYANTCDSSEEKELFKRCVSAHLEKLKNILESCKKKLGEDAKECCIDGKCLDVINGGNSSCSKDERDEGDSCDRKRYLDRIASEVLKNINMGQLTKSLIDSLKGGLKKLGGKLENVVPRKDENCCTDTLGDQFSSHNMKNGAGVPPGILIYPMDKDRYDMMANMFKTPLGGNGSNGSAESFRQGSDCINAQCLQGGRENEAGMQHTNDNGSRKMESKREIWQTPLEDLSGNQESSRHSGSSRGNAVPVCTPQICATLDKYDISKSGKSCKKYCESRKNIEDDNKMKNIGDESELTDDSYCGREK